jgi:stage V sporulation protein R
MYLIDQRTKRIMEECKARAKNAGLSFGNETLEYIVTNRDMIRLSPKVMIPTLYDYWVHDVEILQGEGKYKLYPANPYETVINSRPAISFYNDNNPDWLNIMIFYHVIGHVDFFQNNKLFEHTWNDDFVGVALADKRLTESLRSKYGRWVDYIIEFSRSIDNIVGYFNLLSRLTYPAGMDPDEKVMFYFNTFLQDIAKVNMTEIHKQKEYFNSLLEQHGDVGNSMFFSDIRNKYPEFESAFAKYRGSADAEDDILMYIRDNSPFLKREENRWMQQIMTIIRNTALYFAPQIRSKIMNEGWASYWHDKLFISDKRISGHEADYARINAGVTSISRVGLNPYAIGLRMFYYIEDLANAGKLSYYFQKLTNAAAIDSWNKNTGLGKETIFSIRRDFSDFTFINTFVDQEFVNRYNLFVVGKRLNTETGMFEYYIKSRKASDYKEMLLDSLYHPPLVKINHEKTDSKNLYLIHQYEGKQLVKDFVPDVLIGIEFLWGSQVQLETNNIIRIKDESRPGEIKLEVKRILYTCKNKQISAIEL